jgi:hypothetical protein
MRPCSLQFPDNTERKKRGHVASYFRPSVHAHWRSRSKVSLGLPQNTARRPQQPPCLPLLCVRGDGSGASPRRPASGHRRGQPSVRVRVNRRSQPAQPSVEERVQVHPASDAGLRASHISSTFVGPRIAPPCGTSNSVGDRAPTRRRTAAPLSWVAASQCPIGTRVGDHRAAMELRDG